MAQQVESTREGTEDEIRAVERARVRALVDDDLETASRLHADNFQLISPGGRAYSKEEYLGYAASGAIHYLMWEVDSEIAVCVHGHMAAIRYRSHMERIAHGQRYIGRFWHTNTYEKNDGQWQVVWTQLTQIQA
jgi:hypothetical protein